MTIPVSEQEAAIIKAEYLHKPVKRLARELGWNHNRLRNYLQRNGLVIPPEVVERNKRGSYFSKGHVSHNKGKKQHEFMSADAIERTKATRFKKGDEPHNTKHDGCIVQRADTTGRYYKYIRPAIVTGKHALC